MKINYEATDLENAVLETINDNYYLDNKCIKEKSTSRKELVIDKTFAASLTAFDKLEDYTTKKIFEALENIFRKENKTFVNLSKEGVYECEIEMPNIYHEIKDFIKEFNAVQAYSIDSITLQYYKYDDDFNKIKDISEEEYNTKLDAYLTNYNRDIKLYSEETENGKIIFPFVKYTIEPTSLKSILNINMFNAKKHNIKQVMNSIRFNGNSYENNLNRMEDILSTMFIPETIKGFTSINYRRLSAVVFMHWLWLVKRNLSDLTTENDMFLIFYSSKHGTGKSTFIENLISKVGRTNYSSKSINDLKDSRESHILSQAILFFDEINENGAVDSMATIKKKITEKTTNTRVMYSNSHTEIKRKFSGIAGANKEINEYFGDDNEHRRFFELRLDDHQNKNHIDVMFKNSSNPIYDEIWSLVDENMAEGYVNEESDIWSDLKTIQATYKNNNTIKTFFDKHSHTYVLDRVMNVKELKAYSKKNNIELKTLSIKQLYKDYKGWCVSNDKKAYFTIENFEKNMDMMNVCKYNKSKGVNINTGQTRYTTYYYLLKHNDVDIEEVEQSTAAVDYMNMIPKIEKDENIDEIASQDDWDL